MILVTTWYLLYSMLKGSAKSKSSLVTMSLTVIAVRASLYALTVTQDEAPLMISLVVCLHVPFICVVLQFVHIVAVSDVVSSALQLIQICTLSSWTPKTVKFVICS